MQDNKTRMLISGMSWESQETVALKNVYAQIQSFYQHTELNLDDVGKSEILGELKALSSKIEYLIRYTGDEMDRLVERDSKIKKTCMGCESDKTYYCNTCMIDIEKEDERLHSHSC